MFDPPPTLNTIDRHGGFTVLSHGDTFWQPARETTDTLGTLVDGSVKRDDFYQLHQPVISALYKIPGYRHPVKVWWHPTGERIA
jgi:hypothetical protein